MEHPKLIQQRNRLSKLQEKLSAILGTMYDVYQKRTLDYFSGKLSVRDYHAFVYSVLPKKKAKLHNAFIQACIKLANIPDLEVGIEEDNGQNKLKRRRADRLNLEDKEKISLFELKEILKNLGKSTRNKLKNLKSAKKVEEKPKKQIQLADKVIHLKEDQNPRETLLPYEAPLLQESQTLPTSKEIRNRVHSIASEYNLEVDPLVGEVILHGLETHLQNILVNVIDKVRSQKLSKFRSVNRGSLPAYIQSLRTLSQKVNMKEHLPGIENVEEYPYIPLNRTISTTDLLLTFKLSPYLTVETPMVLEKLILMHHPAYIQKMDDLTFEAFKELRRKRRRFF